MEPLKFFHVIATRTPYGRTIISTQLSKEDAQKIVNIIKNEFKKLKAEIKKEIKSKNHVVMIDKLIKLRNKQLLCPLNGYLSRSSIGGALNFECLTKIYIVESTDGICNAKIPH